ncbi:aldolase [Laetiporus sulphureus 93-53]|uniref:hydroxymethylglutaryl-CoA lyase n=1 Tax=Laetiporus sulphureus 93-53 TaxID=1314785 RepID=A0A165BMK8_9APHY|nr:aldolase [Laetiporus sulphureus 93-53]KZT01315.1 aldolase [Laetiporus sulphureus 93-53]
MFSRSAIRSLACTRSRILKSHGYATVSSHPDSNYVTVVEVGPRDGLQNEKAVVPPSVKAELITRLGHAGMKVIEAGSFVSPKWIPQMAGTPEVLMSMERLPGNHYPVLVPNMKGLENLFALLATENPPSPQTPHHADPSVAPLTDEIAIFTAATDAFAKANTNCTIVESLERLEKVTERALAKGLRVRGYVSVVVICPYSGRVDYRKVKEVTRALLDMGCYEVSLGDTVGAGTPADIREMLEVVMGGDSSIPASKLAGHFHDTYGTGVANVLTALDMGLRTVDAAVGGLGGCPYSPGATGNVATEDVVYALRGSKYKTSGDFEALAHVGDWISTRIGRRSESRAGRAILAKRERERLEHDKGRDGGLAESISAKL